MARYSASFSHDYVSKQMNYLEKIKTKADKNFKDMAFENAVERNHMEDLKNELKHHCDSLIHTLQSYHFN